MMGRIGIEVSQSVPFVPARGRKGAKFCSPALAVQGSTVRGMGDTTGSNSEDTTTVKTTSRGPEMNQEEADPHGINGETTLTAGVTNTGNPETAGPPATTGNIDSYIDDCNSSLSCISFNCKGFMHTNDYIADLLVQCDILCLTETWLRPGQLPGIRMWLDSHPKLKGSQFSVFSKSSMEDLDDSYRGRPFGGIAIIVKKHKSLNVSEITCSSDRLLSIAFKNKNDNYVQVVCNVYMPFFDSSNVQCIDRYVETIDELQSMVDDYNRLCPVKFFGAPRSSTWYNSKGFTKLSGILYNFLKVNSFVAADMAVRQDVNYTYFCHKRNVFTWIDHVLCAEYDVNSVLKCKIIMSADNDSDHLPLLTVFRVNVSLGDNFVSSQNHTFCSVPWPNDSFKQKYQELLDYKLTSIRPIDIHETSSEEKAQSEVDRYLNDIRQAMLESTSEAGSRPKKYYAPKPYWCPELSEMRDKKRFWWRLWVDCGRPRQGPTFDCYKQAKKMFRRLSRDCMNKVMENGFSKFNELFYKKNLRAFWQYVKKSRRHSVNTKLKVDTLGAHFESIMTDNGVLSQEQEHIAARVNEFYAILSRNQAEHYDVSSNVIRRYIDALKNNCSPGIDGITGEHLKYGKSDILCETLAKLFSCILSYRVVPSVFYIGVIIPILKKPSLNPNDTSSYRPVTLSSVFSKLLEMLMQPSENICDTQYGFRQGRGTSLACTLYNDVKCYFEHAKSVLFTCSLDAEKCFDSIWHQALFYKLIDRIPNSHWLTLYRWYRGLKATVKMNNE